MRGNLQEELKIALQIDADVRTHKEELLLLIGNMQAMQRKKKRIGFFEFILRQIRFMGKNLWLTQGAAAFAMFGIGYLSTGKDIEGLCIRHIPLLLGVFAIMQVMASIPLLLTSYRYQMHEIEMASRISLPRLLMAKLIILAVEYLAVFVFCVGLSVGMAGMPAVSLAVYFVFPLLAACTGCVQIIRHTEGWEEVAGRVGACEGYCVCLGAVFIVLYGMKPFLYGNVRLWMLLMSGLFPLFILSVGRWVKESGEVGERLM